MEANILKVISLLFLTETLTSSQEKGSQVFLLRPEKFNFEFNKNVIKVYRPTKKNE